MKTKEAKMNRAVDKSPTAVCSFFPFHCTKLRIREIGISSYEYWLSVSSMEGLGSYFGIKEGKRGGEEKENFQTHQFSRMTGEDPASLIL